MAPTKVKNSGNKDRQVKKSSKSSAPKAVSTKASKVHRAKAPPPKQQKTKPVLAPVKKKQRLYSEKELDLPRLNMITPVGVNLPQGKKKGKVFIDDQESMMTILAIVNADKDGQIESKLMKSRQMEEIREARRKEAEARQEQKASKLENLKVSLRRKRKRKNDTTSELRHPEDKKQSAIEPRSAKKRVTFV
ncbi:MAG: hypothetical protein Q9190_005296 [Brigantiaea leucoxantha]